MDDGPTQLLFRQVLGFGGQAFLENELVRFMFGMRHCHPELSIAAPSVRAQWAMAFQRHIPFRADILSLSLEIAKLRELCAAHPAGLAPPIGIRRVADADGASRRSHVAAVREFWLDLTQQLQNSVVGMPVAGHAPSPLLSAILMAQTEAEGHGKGMRHEVFWSFFWRRIACKNARF